MSFFSFRRRASVIAPLAIAPLVVALASSCGSTVDEQVSTASTSGPAGAGGSATTSGEGGGSSTLCVPGTLIECYTGPEKTEDVGVCHGGAKKCDDIGMSFGECEWEVTPKPEDCNTPDDEDCDGQTPACPGQAVWSEAYAGQGNEYAQQIAIDPAGNILVAGGFDGTFVLAGNTMKAIGLSDFFVAKFDPTGKPIWAKSFGSAADDYAVDIASDAQGNVVVTGSVGGAIDLGDGPLAGFGADDIFILKLDAQGNFLWRKMFGSAEPEIAYGIAVDAAGDVIATGNFNGTVDFGTGALTATASDIFIAKYDPAGAPLWVKQFGGMYDDYGSDVEALPSGDLLVTGGFYGPVDFGTGPLITAGGYDAFVARFDAAGKAVWAAQLKGTQGMNNFPVTFSVAADPTGAALVAGYFRGKVDFGGGPVTSAGGTDAFVAKYDGDTGKHVFSQRFGGSYVYPGQPTYVTDAAFSVATDAAGNIQLTGSYIDTIDLGGGPLGKQPYGDMFFARFDPSGKHLFSDNYGTAVSFANGSAVAVTKSGNAVLAGYFVGTIDFGNGPLTTENTQDTDMFLAEIAP